MELFPPGAILFDPIGTLLVPARRGAGEEAPLAPAPGAHDLLDELAADQVLLAAVGQAEWSPPALAAELERHGLRRSFPCIVTGSERDRPPFVEALHRLRVPAGQAWLVAASFDRDLAGAQVAGLLTVCVDAGAAPPPAPTPHVRVGSLDALLALYVESQRAAAPLAPLKPGDALSRARRSKS